MDGTGLCWNELCSRVSRHRFSETKNSRTKGSGTFGVLIPREVVTSLQISRLFWPLVLEIDDLSVHSSTDVSVHEPSV